MKLKFKTQQFQTDAVNAICDLFTGQEKSRATFSIVEDAQLSMMQNELGVGNALLIGDDTMLKNMQAIQRRNHLQLTKGDWKGGFSFPISFPMSIPARQAPQFCVEMETGERVIIVTGCINALRSRVSGTLVNMIHALLRVIKYNYCKQCMRSKDVLALQY